MLFRSRSNPFQVLVQCIRNALLDIHQPFDGTSMRQQGEESPSSLGQFRQMADEYPAKQSEYIDGKILEHWKSNKAIGSNAVDAASVTTFVCIQISSFISCL